jgi:hypothetical protein
MASGEEYITVCFENPGPLGLGLAARTSDSPPIVTELAPDSPASKQPLLRLGLTLFAVNGEEIDGLQFDQILHTIKVARPTALTFRVPSKPVLPARAPATPPRVTPPREILGESEDLGSGYQESLLEPQPEPEREPTRGQMQAQARVSAAGDMAAMQEKITSAAKLIAPLAQRCETARVAYVAARAALDELQQTKASLIQQLMYLMTHSEGVASGAGEIPALQQRIEELGRALASAEARYEAAEFEYLEVSPCPPCPLAGGLSSLPLLPVCLPFLLSCLCFPACSHSRTSVRCSLKQAKEDLEDAVARKRLLVESLTALMDGEVGSEGRLAVNCALSIRARQQNAVVAALDGAAMVLQMASTAYFLGYVTVVPDLDLDHGEGAEGAGAGGAGGAGEGGGAEGLARLFEVFDQSTPEELRFELHAASAARGWRAPVASKDSAASGGGAKVGLIQPPTDIPLAVATASVPFVMATAALDLHLPIRIAPVSPLMQTEDVADVLRAQSQHPGLEDGGAVGGWHVCEVHVETLFVPQAEADEFIGVHTAALWFEKKGPIDLRDSYGFAIGADTCEWRRGESHARCMESLQRDCWEALAQSTSGGGQGLSLYSLDHFGAGGQEPRQESLAAWWQQTAGVRALVRGGIPPEDRGRLWFELSGAADQKRQHEASYFSDLVERATTGKGDDRAEESQAQGEKRKKDQQKREKQLEKDIVRTFASEKTAVNSDEGKASLRRVLLAYAAHNPAVGYCQRYTR